MQSVALESMDSSAPSSSHSPTSPILHPTPKPSAKQTTAHSSPPIRLNDLTPAMSAKKRSAAVGRSCSMAPTQKPASMAPMTWRPLITTSSPPSTASNTRSHPNGALVQPSATAKPISTTTNTPTPTSTPTPTAAASGAFTVPQLIGSSQACSAT